MQYRREKGTVETSKKKEKEKEKKEHEHSRCIRHSRIVELM